MAGDRDWRLEIVATGNHIWLDAAAGVVAAGLGCGIVRAIDDDGWIPRWLGRPIGDGSA